MQQRLTSDRLAAIWHARRAGAVLAILTLALSGCVSLQTTEVVKQTTPGKVTIRTVVCASNYNHTVAAPVKDWTDCQPGKIAATDNDRLDAGTAGSGYLLIGFRVPLGFDGPQSFLTKDGGFTRSESYTAELKRFFAPPADQQWIGYISTVNSYNPASAHSVEVATDFTLPAAAAPFTAPMRWRTVVGFGKDDPPATVACGTDVAKNHCFDSPAPGDVTKDNPATAVSDFGLVGGATTTVFPGTDAVVPFKLRYSDAGNLGRKSFSLSAKTEMPQTNARAAPQTISANPNSTTEATATVPVPTNMPTGRYTVTLTSAIGTVTRAAAGTIVVASLPQGTKPLEASGNVTLGTIKTRTGGGRKILRMLVTGIPADGSVTVRCRGGRGAGCAFTSKTIKRRRTVNLAGQFRGRTLRPQAVVMLVITGPNRIGKEFRIVIRKPVLNPRCRPPGAKKALSCGR